MKRHEHIHATPPVVYKFWCQRHSTYQPTLCWFLDVETSGQVMLFDNQHFRKTRSLLSCNVSSAWRDQMSSSDFVATATENASRWGYKHACVNYLHVASHDYPEYQEVIQHTHTHPHTHSLTHSTVLFFLAQLPSLFQHEFKWRMKVPNIIESKTSVTSMS